jgi:hypothetical protein
MTARRSGTKSPKLERLELSKETLGELTDEEAEGARGGIPAACQGNLNTTVCQKTGSTCKCGDSTAACVTAQCETTFCNNGTL